MDLAFVQEDGTEPVGPQGCALSVALVIIRMKGKSLP